MSAYSKKDLLLKADNICLSYDKKKILRNINFEIFDIFREGMNQGQVVSLVGRSGIGKTQLFKILAGLIKPTSGRVLLDKNQHPVVAGDVGIVHQNYILFNHRTIYDNLKIGMDHAEVKSTPKQQEEIINQYANDFGLMEHLRKYPMQLSGGQRQRCSIIQQVLTGNRFILLDEPFSGLDAVVKDKVLSLLVKVSTMHEDNTLVIVSHDIESAFAISDTAFILANQAGEEGSTIVETIDLMAMGLAWDPEVKKNKAFHDLVDQIKYKL
jgi:ABC-type nitrate/sulfonate/bicarbonate transport system ATPase subunit